MGAVLLLALYGLCLSGHFPAQFRGEKLSGASGTAVLAASAVAAVAAGVAALMGAAEALPWYAAVIGAGAVLLFAPLLLQPLPDSFVDGRPALLVFSGGAALLAAAMWVAF
jgi:hypothetical protein